MMRLLASVLVLAMSAGCSSIPGFGEKDDDGVGPAPLTKIQTERDLVRVWSRSIGNGQGGGFNKLKPAIDGAEIYAAAANGEVYALDSRSGKTRWRKKLKTGITGAVGLSEGLVLVGLENGELVAMSRTNGSEFWRKQMGAEILAPASGRDGRVVVHTYDGKIRALSAANGEEIWSYAALVPRLTIRGTSSPQFYRSLVITGLANGRVIGLDVATGTLAWEQRVAVAEGGTEIERLTDVDGDVLIEEPVVYATAFSGNILAVGLDGGERRWGRPASANVGPASGYGNIYVATMDGSVTAYKKTGQDVTWTQSVLARRKLTQPATLGDSVIVGDFEGYLHALSQVDGHQMARLRVDSGGLRAPLMSVSGTLYVYGNSGTLSAYRWAGEGVRGESIFSRLNPFGKSAAPAATAPYEADSTYDAAPAAPSNSGASLEDIIRESESRPVRPAPIYDRDNEALPVEQAEPVRQAPVQRQPAAPARQEPRQEPRQAPAPAKQAPAKKVEPFNGRKWWQIFGSDDPAPVERRSAPTQERRAPSPPPSTRGAPAQPEPFNLPPSAQDLNNEPVTARQPVAAPQQRPAPSADNDDPFNGRKWWQIFGRDEVEEADPLPVISPQDEEEVMDKKSRAKPRRPIDDEQPGYEPQADQEAPRSGRAVR